ncbi:monocarboxylate transporter 2 isoform X2 [Octopus bimaculoides]|uniref:monocarboxylate transporter 2 isoform X2 n=1 Tax=Octopus bimaculoides TaxID=37653 RepID=UPI0022DFD4F2|nr:monocarboxylate transporter 2 isoform X2 [Octopus bimaculoides]
MDNDEENVKEPGENVYLTAKAPEGDVSLSHSIQNLTKSVQNLARDDYIKDHPVKPVDAFSWIVLLTAFISVTICTGVIGSLSVFYVEFLHAFSNSKAEIAIVHSLANGMYDIGGVLAGIMIDRIGCRASMVAGGLMTAVSIAVSFFAKSIYFLIFSLGTISALGSSIVMLSGMVLVGQRFGPEHPIGTVIVSGSHPSGFVLFPIFMPYLIESFGWRGSLLLLSAISLHIIPFALLATYGLPKKKRPPKEEGNEKVSLKKQCSECCPFDMQLFKTGHFQLFALTSAVTWSANYLIHLLIVDFGENRGYSLVESSSLLTTLGVAAIISRFLALLVKTVNKFSNIAMFIFFCAAATILHGCIPLSNSFYSLMAMVATVGIIFGLRFSYFMLSLIDLVPMEKYSQALGYTLSLWGISVALLGPIVGEVSSLTGSYDFSYYCGGVVGGLALIPISVYIYFNGWPLKLDKCDSLTEERAV